MKKGKAEQLVLDEFNEKLAKVGAIKLGELATYKVYSDCSTDEMQLESVNIDACVFSLHGATITIPNEIIAKLIGVTI